MRLGYDPHEINIREDCLDLDELDAFVASAIGGDRAEFHFSGAECGKWQCDDGKLYVELYSCDALAARKCFDLSEADGRWAKRLRSTAETVRQWRTRERDYDRVIVAYDGSVRMGEYDDHEPGREWHAPRQYTPEEQAQQKVLAKEFTVRMEKYKAEERARPPNVTSGGFFSLIALGPQDRMLMVSPKKE